MNNSFAGDKSSNNSAVIYQLLRDRHFIVAAVSGIAVVALLDIAIPTPTKPGSLFTLSAWHIAQLLLIYPVLEEILFRGVIQEWCTRRISGRVGPLSRANIATSLLFALSHLPNHPTAWAMAVLVPSLVFGHFRDRTNHLLPPILLHMLYNTLFFLRFPPVSA